MGKVREAKNSPSLVSVNFTASPSLAEGARGWVDSLLLNFALLLFRAFNPPPLSPSAREGEVLLSLRGDLSPKQSKSRDFKKSSESMTKSESMNLTADSPKVSESPLIHELLK